MERLSIQKPQSGWMKRMRSGPAAATRVFYAAGDLFGCLDVVDLDVDHADAEGDARVDLLQGVQVALWAVGEFEHQVVSAQFVEKVDQGAPLALLDGLAAVVAKAEVDGLLGCLCRCCRVRR